MGVLTGCLGGIIRDVLAGEPSILMRPELYVTVAALSAALFVGLTLRGVPGGIAGLIAALAGFALRGAAILRGWSLPAYGALSPVQTAETGRGSSGRVGECAAAGAATGRRCAIRRT